MDIAFLRQKAREEIKRRRQTAEAQAAENLDFLCGFSDFKNAYERERQCELDMLKAKRCGRETLNIQNELTEAKRATEDVLKAHNATRQQLLPNYCCKKCCDTGAINGINCSCYEEIFFDLTFGKWQTQVKGSFDKNTETDLSNLGIFKLAENWCESYPKIEKTNFFLCGHTGVGKTFLSDCIASKLSKKNVNVLYLTAYELNNMFKEDVLSCGRDRLLDGLTAVDVLIVDDLGKEPIYKKISLESLYCLLNERLLNNRSTIVSSNLSLSEILDKYGESILARLVNKQNTYVFELSGKDKRLK